MKRIKITQKNFCAWLKVFPKLIYEIFLFIIQLPNYLYLFFHGLRITAGSYSQLFNGLNTYKKAIENLFTANLDEQKTTEMFRKLLNETIRLRNEQEKSFTALFGIFIAILALLISIIALLLRR